LESIINQLTLSETTALIQLEQRTLRRKSIVKRLQRHSRKLAVEQLNHPSGKMKGSGSNGT
jgi:hypothetical protein